MVVTPSVNDVIYGLVDGLMGAAAIHNALIGAVLNDLDLTRSQANALWSLQPDSPRRMGDLAERLDCDPSTLTDIVDALERKNYVERVVSAADRRVKLLSPTTQGIAARQSLIDFVTSQTPLSRLSNSDRSELLRLLALIN